jgi:protein-S-isoprenylcysteine O-methyltransferase Ste14
MISLTVTGYLNVKLEKYFKFYRLFFNFTAFITLVPLILYTQSLKGNLIFRWEGHLLLIKYFLAAISAALLIAGALKYDMFQFIGVRQIISGKSYSTLSENGEIVTSGILGITRHPWYLGSIIFFWIYYNDLYVSTLIVSVILTIYLVIGAALEEKKLLLEFGASYRDYMTRVSMLFPFKWLFSKL